VHAARMGLTTTHLGLPQSLRVPLSPYTSTHGAASFLLGIRPAFAPRGRHPDSAKGAQLAVLTAWVPPAMRLRR
jgi:hypothetical protein